MHMVRLSESMRWLTLSLAGAVSVAGCAKTEKGPDTSRVAAARVAAPANTTADFGRLANMDSAGIEKIAESYTFRPKKSPVKGKRSVANHNNPGVALAGAPTLEIEAANPSTPPGGSTGVEILAKVTSSGKYPGLGIGKGTNYIVRDKNGSTDSKQWRVYVVSTKPFGVLRLTADYAEYSDGDPMEPRIVYSEFKKLPTRLTDDMIAYAFCFDDPSCQATGHCGYNNGT
jgi:hypothetical protein